MKRLALLSLLFSPLCAKEAIRVLPEASSDWKMAGPGSFELKGGISTAKGGMGLWWYSKKQFSNACFTVEFMAPEDADNSGIFVRFPDPGNDPWVAVNQGYEIQICGNESHKNKTGAIYDIQPGIHPDMKIGEWNTYKIITAGDQIAIILNDKLINVYKCKTDRGDEKGYFGLQNHDNGSPVQFRNVKVQELASGSLLSAMSELEIPRSALTAYNAAATPKEKWYHLADHGPAFFQTYGDWFNGKQRRESALKGILLSYSALPNQVALFNTENLSLVSATDKGVNLINTPWGGGHGRVNEFNNKDSYLFTAAEGPVWADASGSF